MLRPLSRRIRRALTSHGRVFLVFVGVSFTVCIVLLIIAIRNIEQERDLRDIQIQDRLTYTANMIKDHVESDIRHIREELYSLNSIYSLSAGNTSFTNSFRPRPHIIYIVSNPLSVQTRPDSILTYPPVIWEGTPPYGYDVLPDGSLYERNQNWRLAVEYYKRLRRTDEYREVWDAHFLDPRVQLLSEIRLARNAAKDGNIEEALQCYGALRDSNTHLQVGIPVGMLARYARCLLFDNLGRIAERNSEARSLIQCLENGDYTLTYTSYRYYLDATHELLGSDVDGYTAEADSTRLNTVPFPIDEAVNWAWHDWLEQRRTLSSTDMTYSPVRSHLGHATICWAGTADNMVAILAPTPVYIDEYFPQLLQIPSEHLTIVQITDAEGRILAGDSHVTSNTRSIQISLGENLPWNVTLRPTAEMMSDNHTMKRQTTLLIIIGMLVVSMLVSGYALSRTITHELAAIKIKSDFISTVSHELRSPLTTIRQLSELLEDGRFKDEYERADYLGGGGCLPVGSSVHEPGGNCQANDRRFQGPASRRYQSHHLYCFPTRHHPTSQSLLIRAPSIAQSGTSLITP